MRRYLNKHNTVRLGVVGISLSVASMFYATGCGGGGGSGGGIDPTASLCSTPIEASFSDGLAGQTRIGGATTSVALVDVADANWTLYNTANELRAADVANPIKTAGLEVDGYIHDIEIVKYGDNNIYALLAMGDEGIQVVNVTNPLSMEKASSVKVSYEQTGITIAEGSGNPADINISSSRAPISSLAVYNEGNETDPSWQLIIGDEGYGLHKTSLSNLMNGILDNGTLLIDGPEKYTLQYAGESPWGGPKSITLFGEGNSTRLFVAQGFMGMGIYDPKTLEKVGRYNHYIDTNPLIEDWFSTNVANDVQQPSSTYLDACTGMPNYEQAGWEIITWREGDHTIKTPWADFEFYGKYYYDARKVDVANVGDKTYAYIAYGLAGMVAVDVTGYDTATARTLDCSSSPAPGFLEGTYLGYVPAMPVKGPEDRLIGQQDSGSLLSRMGAGMLKDAGVVDVKVDANIDPTKVFYTDHFGGLMVINNADTPDNDWHGPLGSYDNDTNKSVEHVPSYDFVTSYNMTPSSSDEEALPQFTIEEPMLLTTGEVGGHGNSLALTGSIFDESNDMPVDVIMAAGAGGLNFIEVYGTAPAYYDFNVTTKFATTDEIGADEYGDATVPVNIGHAAGVGTYDNLLYLADGPHGVSVWEVADKSCNNIPTDQVGLVGNTLQAEGSVEVNGTTIYPTPHADDVIVINDGVTKSALVASLSTGLRRVNVNDMGTKGAPALLYPTSGDIFQHSVEESKVSGINYEDRVYSVAVYGDYAFTADGLSGVTVYDLSKTPDTNNSSGFIVDNIKVGTNATDIALWYDASSSKRYAFVAVGSKGISVIDVTVPSNLVEIGTFEPYKVNPDDVVEGSPSSPNTADGVSVSLKIVGDHVFFTYDSFGVLAYRIADLIEPDISTNRPVAEGYFKLQNESTYTNSVGTDFTEWSGGATGIDAISVSGNTYVYVAYGNAGVIKINWSDVANPVLEEHANTSGSATDVVVWNGRVYVADGAGGLVLLK